MKRWKNAVGRGDLEKVAIHEKSKLFLHSLKGMFLSVLIVVGGYLVGIFDRYKIEGWDWRRSHLNHEQRPLLTPTVREFLVEI
jgi:hypothetical protein